MAVAAALAELFDGATQTAIAERLSASGLPADQTKVSAWKRGRIPDLEQLVAIEECYDRPRGWVLARAGFVDVDGLVATTRRDGAARDTSPRLPSIESLDAEIEQLQSELRALRRSRRAIARSATASRR